MYSQIIIGCQSKEKVPHCDDCVFSKSCNARAEIKKKKEDNSNPTNNCDSEVTAKLKNSEVIATINNITEINAILCSVSKVLNKTIERNCLPPCLEEEVSNLKHNVQTMINRLQDPAYEDYWLSL